MTEKAKRKKHVSYQAQREQCRLNKYTYEEKIGGAPYLMCNYPFPSPNHKKGLCKANLCTDMREIPDDIVDADKNETHMSSVGTLPGSGSVGAEEKEADAPVKLGSTLGDDIIEDAELQGVDE